MVVYDASAEAIQPLLSAYWSSAGWRTPPVLPVGQVKEKAIGAGVMFGDPVSAGHDEWVARVRASVSRLRPQDVGVAFAVSLTTRRLDLRSALGSFAVGRHLPEHAFESAGGFRCLVCGLPAQAEQDRNLLSFERFKWGGVRRDDLTYIAFDLEQFLHAPLEPLDGAAVELCGQVLERIAEAAPGDTATRVGAGLSIVKGNKAERDMLLEILAVSGVLESPQHPGYRAGFVRCDERTHTGAHFEDRAYPLPWWRGRHGINHAATREWFPFLTATLDGPLTNTPN